MNKDWDGGGKGGERKQGDSGGGCSGIYLGFVAIVVALFVKLIRR